MEFPAYFQSNSQFKSLEGSQGRSIEYFHRSDSVKDIFLNINEFFVLFVLEGTVKFQSPNGLFYVEEGDCAIVNKGTYIMSEGLSGESNCFKAYLFFFEREALEQFYFNHPPKDTNPAVNMRNILLIDSCKFIKTFMSGVELLFSKNYQDTWVEDLMNLKTRELLHYLALNNFSQEIHSMLYPSVSDDNYRLKEVVKNNYLSNLSIKELAFLSSMSLSSFKRKFIEIYKESPAKWIKEKRLEYAFKLMNTGNFKINEVAYKSGFDNPSTFSRLFKNKFGMTPKNYVQE